MKQCHGCGETKPAAEFHVRRAGRDGLADRCKVCSRAAQDLRVARLRRRTDDELAAVDPVEKRCRVCGATKLGAEFPRDRSCVDGRAGHCNLCAAAKVKAYREADPDRRREQSRRSYRKNYDRWVRPYQLKRLFGLTIPQYEALLAGQDGRCAVCRKPESSRSNNGTGETKGLAVDHCHSTGAIRGLLCARCNSALGLFNDDPALLAAAADYLQRARA